MGYNRNQAAAYAHRWAFDRNPRYLDFSKMGGDCTNFVSQCLLAGGLPMNYKKDLGWYYNSAHDRAPAWSGVQYLYNFLVKDKKAGPSAREIPLAQAEIGDVIQLSFDGYSFRHSLFVVRADSANPYGMLVATHSDDSDYRPFSSYLEAQKYRCLHIIN